MDDIPLYVDGADEITGKLAMIKGGGEDFRLHLRPEQAGDNDGEVSATGGSDYYGVRQRGKGVDEAQRPTATA